MTLGRWEQLVTFDEYVGARLGALLRYATVLACSPDLAEDIVQEVLVRAQTRWDRIARADQPEAYIKRMVLNEFLSWRRRRARRAIAVPEEALERAAPVAVDPAARLADRHELMAHIAALPRRQRAVIALRFYEGYTDAEIADLLGCREGTVRSHASRALAALRSAVYPEVGGASARAWAAVVAVPSPRTEGDVP